MTPDSTVFSQYLSSLPPVSEPNFLKNAKTFLTFASGFDLADPKIELKLRHTFHVVDACFYLARALKLSDEEPISPALSACSTILAVLSS